MEKKLITSNFFFSHDVFTSVFLLSKSQDGVVKDSPITKRQILDFSKLKEFATDNFKFDKNGRKLSKRIEITVGKGEIFPQCFQKACFQGGIKRCHCVGRG